jgi:hypothetical protein
VKANTEALHQISGIKIRFWGLRKESCHYREVNQLLLLLGYIIAILLLKVVPRAAGHGGAHL